MQCHSVLLVIQSLVRYSVVQSWNWIQVFGGVFGTKIFHCKLCTRARNQLKAHDCLTEEQLQKLLKEGLGKRQAVAMVSKRERIWTDDVIKYYEEQGSATGIKKQYQKMYDWLYKSRLGRVSISVSDYNMLTCTY